MPEANPARPIFSAAKQWFAGVYLLSAVLLGGCGAPQDEKFTPSGYWQYAAGRDTRGGAVRLISVTAEQPLMLTPPPGKTIGLSLTPTLSLECLSGHWQASLRVGQVKLLGIVADGRPVQVAYRGDQVEGSSAWRADTSMSKLETNAVDFLPVLRNSRVFSFRFDNADATVHEISFKTDGAAATIAGFEQRCTQPPSAAANWLDLLLRLLSS